MTSFRPVKVKIIIISCENTFYVSKKHFPPLKNQLIYGYGPLLYWNEISNVNLKSINLIFCIFYNIE